MYEMKPLDDLHSRRLFFKRIFGSDDQCPGTLNEVSSEILKKCGGLPLAIISISSLLANRSATKQEWEKVKRSIGYALENKQSLEGMNSILSLSYNDLPPNLKTCLLYLSVFPEDYVIDRERLVRRWIAEGFFSEERGQSREEVAENYFYELINKSMLQPVNIGYNGKVLACRVHDMMLEILVSKSHENNFVTVVAGGQNSFSNRQGFIRRLSIQYIDQELASALANEDLSHVRSLTVTPSCGIKHLPSLVQFEALHVLDFEGCEDLDDYDMKGIDKFHQLKYFSARRTKLTRLPSRIVVLDNLETLNLEQTHVGQLPAGIAQLTKLRHLIGGYRIPNGIGDMRKLQLISGFVIDLSQTDAVEDLGNLTSLEELEVDLSIEPYYSCEVPLENKRCEEAFLSALCKLGTCKLRTLEISAYGYPLDFLDSWSPPPSSLQMVSASSGHRSWFKNFPSWITPALTNLVDLDISLKELTNDDLLTLGKLPSLLYLRLELEKFVTVQGISSPSLKVFSLECDSGVYFAFVEGSMPRLENLDISFSVSMARTDGFYLGIEHLPCLKQAKIWLRKDGATPSETQAAAAAIRNEAATHPNHPAVTVRGEPSEESGGSDSENSNEDGSTDED